LQCEHVCKIFVEEGKFWKWTFDIFHELDLGAMIPDEPKIGDKVVGGFVWVKPIIREFLA